MAPARVRGQVKEALPYAVNWSGSGTMGHIGINLCHPRSPADLRASAVTLGMASE